jgi:phage terminase large subunit-like protein
LVYGASIGAGSRRIGNMDIALLAANRRLIIEGRTLRRQGGQKISRQDAKTPRIQSGDIKLLRVKTPWNSNRYRM